MATNDDITARLTEAREILAYFGAFGPVGTLAYEEHAARLFEVLDGTEGAWRFAVTIAVRRLVDLRDTTPVTALAALQPVLWRLEQTIVRYL